MGLACVGWIALGWSVYQRSQDSARIPGAGGRFKANTVSTDGGNWTSVCRAVNGETVWKEYEHTKTGLNSDATIFCYGGKNIAMVEKPAGELPGFEFTFFGADGRPRERWMAMPGSKTWDEWISFVRDSSSPEWMVLIGGKWEPVMMRDYKRCILINGDWVQLGYTNGSWTIVGPVQSSGNE